MQDENLEDLLRRFETAEQEFRSIEDQNATGTLREKQQRAEELLEDIHDQLEFLRAQVDQNG